MQRSKTSGFITFLALWHRKTTWPYLVSFTFCTINITYFIVRVFFPNFFLLPKTEKLTGFITFFGGPGGVRRPSGGRPAALRRSPFEKQKIEKTTGFIRFSLFCAPEVFTCFLLFLKRENAITSRNALRIGDRHVYTNKVFCCSRARLFHICSLICA